MNNFKLESGDILVNIATGESPFAVIKRWALNSPYSHVFMYLGQMLILVDSVVLRHPMLFESSGRGVVLQSLSNRYGQKVAVMRLKSEHDRRRIPTILQKAIELASDEKARYDYTCIMRFIIPMLICQKLGLPISLKYQRNPMMVCSEACAEVFWRAGLDIVPKDTVPLPSSFIESSFLTKIWEGELVFDLV